MKLAFKLTIAIMMAMAILLLIHGFLVVQRDISLYEKDMERHANIVGGMVKATAADILQLGGKDKLADAIQKINSAEKFLKIRLVDIDRGASDLPNLHVNDDDLEQLRSGNEIMRKGAFNQNEEYLFAYFPVLIGESYSTAVEIAESLAPMKGYVKDTILRKIILFIAIVISGGLLVLWLGAAMVGGPVSKMVKLANQVSNGNFEGNLPISSKNDELTELAAGLNDMAKKLDISRRRLEEEIFKKMEAQEQLHHAERLATVGKLASGLAHELGTPLNVISGRAKMVTSGQLGSEDIRECSEIITEQSARMTKIIRQLLDFARRRRPEKSSVSIVDTIDKVLSLLRPMATVKSVTLSLETADSLPDMEIDQGQIQQVLSNLIINAIQAMQDGGIIKIIIRQERVHPPADLEGGEADYLCIAIIDEGVGITKENLSRIFTPFFSTKDVGKGTGLGLSISHGIIREHKGWINVSSEHGHGSVFSIYLPMEVES